MILLGRNTFGNFAYISFVVRVSSAFRVALNKLEDLQFIVLLFFLFYLKRNAKNRILFTKKKRTIKRTNNSEKMYNLLYLCNTPEKFNISSVRNRSFQSKY